MPDHPKRRSRFARLYGDGSMTVLASHHDWHSARRELLASSDDDDTELLEVEISVIRTHGKPKLVVTHEREVRCPCCGEMVPVKEAARDE